MKLIYIIEAVEQKAYKIGYTANVEQRLGDLQVGAFFDLRIVHTFETENIEAEKLLHKIFRNKKIRGEWYGLDSFDLTFIERIGESYNTLTA